MGNKRVYFEGIVTTDEKGNVFIADIKSEKELEKGGYTYTFTDNEQNKVYKKKENYAILCMSK